MRRASLIRSISLAGLSLGAFACGGDENDASGSVDDASDLEPSDGDMTTESGGAVADANGDDEIDDDIGESDDTSDSEAPDESLVVFGDPDSDFSTSAVYDADREVMNFHATTNALIWSDGSMVSGFAISDAFLTDDEYFMVRFGTEDGQRRAYFTETDAGTICDVMVSGDEQISIFATDETPPQE